MTASQIADALGEGVSRNAVIGKAHRLGLQSRPSPVKATDAPSEAAPAAAAALRLDEAGSCFVVFREPAEGGSTALTGPAGAVLQTPPYHVPAVIGRAHV